jgi:hypothetical protein
MKKIILFLGFASFFWAAAAMATPPTSISLAYDTNKGSLHIEAVHPSFDLEKSYVRLVNIYVNGNLVNSLNYYRQDAPDKFTDDVPLTAQAGDVIKADLFCTLGGEMAQEMTVTQPGATGTPSAPAGTDNSTADNGE